MHLSQPAVWLAIVGACAVPGIAAAQESFTGAGQISEMDCAGSSATIQGASNEIRITGNCTLLEIEGASNRITVAMGRNGTIRVTGADNRINWSTPDGSKPRLQVVGAGNRIVGPAAK